MCTPESKEECTTTYEEKCKVTYAQGKKCEKVPHKQCKYVQVRQDSKDRNNDPSTVLPQVPRCEKSPYQKCEEGYEDKCKVTRKMVGVKVTKHRCSWPKRTFSDDTRC